MKRRPFVTSFVVLALLPTCFGGRSSGEPRSIEATEVEADLRSRDAHSAASLPTIPEPVPVADPISHLDPTPTRGRHDDRPPGMTIDDELERLGYVLGSLRAARGKREGGRAPRPALAAWDRVLEELDEYLDQPPGATPADQLVRAKVTVETELEQDALSWGVPGHLRARVRSRLAYLEQRIERADEFSAPRPGGGEKQSLSWPLEPVLVTSDFGWRRDPFHGGARFHYGVDLVASFGQLVTAAGEGVIEYADWNGGHGKHIEISHPSGWRTRYSHLAELLVRAGDEVEEGDPIGLAGDTGRSTGPHLHFEVWREGDVRDPMEVLGDPPLYFSDIGLP